MALSIMTFPFQTEVSLQDWHYQAGGQYRSAAEIITRLMQDVSRNGCLLLNTTQRGRGDIEDEARRICLDSGRWIEINSDAVYSARPFDVWSDEKVIYTRQDGSIYAVLVNWEGNNVNLGAIADQKLAGGVEVLKISYSKNWFNDDDPGVATFGWDRKCNLRDGSFNNDISFSGQVGDTWSVDFEGREVSIVAPEGVYEGLMKVSIDGHDSGTVQLTKRV